MTALFIDRTPDATATETDDRSASEDRRSVLGRIAVVVEAFEADSVLSLGELTARTGLPRSTTYRLAEQLLSIGWLDRVPSGYRIGLRLFELGGLASSATRMRNSAVPWALQVHEQTRMTVHLGVLDGDEVVYLDKLSPRNTEVPTRIGGRWPAHRTALGKSMLAFEPAARLTSLLDTLADDGVRTSELEAELELVRQRGIASEIGESVSGLSCVAAPVRGMGRAIAAISITCPVDDLNLRRYASIVKSAADGIWNDLFGSNGR